MHRKLRRAFTLIELLVVIAIITMLIAILLPSLGRALFTSRIAACGANLRQVGVGVFAYTGDNFTMYPYPTTYGPVHSFHEYDGVAYRSARKPWVVRESGTTSWDMLSQIEDYYDGGMRGTFTCQNVAPEWSEAAKDKFPWKQTNAEMVTYALLFNSYYQSIVDKPMRRVGERWRQAVTNVTMVATRGEYFNVLAMDTASRHQHFTEQRGNHPSYGYQAGFFPWNNAAGAGLISNGTLNANYLTDDGAVRNFDGITSHDTDHYGGVTQYFLIPREMATTDPGPR